MTIEQLSITFLKSIVASALGLAVALFSGLLIIAIIYQTSFERIIRKLIELQYGIIFSFTIMVVLVFFEQVYKAKKKNEAA